MKTFSLLNGIPARAVESDFTFNDDVYFIGIGSSTIQMDVKLSDVKELSTHSVDACSFVCASASVSRGRLRMLFTVVSM